MTGIATKTYWAIEDALKVIRELEPDVKSKASCFLGLCGGVLRNGHSHKDLDIIVIPMNGDVEPDTRKALELISKSFGVEFVYSKSAIYNGQKYVPLDFYSGETQHGRIDVILYKN